MLPCPSIIDESLILAKQHNILPLSVVVLDAGGQIVAGERERPVQTALESTYVCDTPPMTCIGDAPPSLSVKRQDGSAVMRVDIAMGKAYGALSMVRTSY